jgi:hypothetical protein
VKVILILSILVVAIVAHKMWRDSGVTEVGAVVLGGVTGVIGGGFAYLILGNLLSDSVFFIVVVIGGLVLYGVSSKNDK